MDDDRSTEFLRFMSRHLVALTSECERYENGQLQKRGLVAFSGFVLEILDRWFFVTAGHCLKALDEGIENKTVRVLQTQFMDCFGPGDTHLQGIPYTYERECGFCIENRDMALDFGLIPLSELYRQNMTVNGLLPITRTHWERQDGLDWSQYKMLGFPEEEYVSQTDEMGVLYEHITPTMFPIDRLTRDDISDPPEGAWFIGRIPSDVPIHSVKGMSGGPIYGFRQRETGQWTYHIVALQSWWRPKPRVTFGCSLPLFAEAVHKALEGEAHAYLIERQAGTS